MDSNEVEERWGNTNQYKQYIEKSKNRFKEEQEHINKRLLEIFKDLGNLKHLSIEDKSVQNRVDELKKFITENYYECDNSTLSSLGQMYVNDGRFKNNIDNVGGEGTAEFVHKAIQLYVNQTY